MFRKLTELFETVSSRRSFIGRSGVRITALMAAMFGFTRRAEAGNCPSGCSGHSVECCCLCLPHENTCWNNCSALSGSCSWYWPCWTDTGYMRTCFECFWNSGACSGNCADCINAYCSQVFY